MSPQHEPWIDALRNACAVHGQAEIARRLRIAMNGKYPSDTVISQALNGKYPGNVERLRDVVEGVLMAATVDCPVIGEMPRERCIDNQNRNVRFAATNPMRVQLAKACPTCEHNRSKKP